MPEGISNFFKSLLEILIKKGGNNMDIESFLLASGLGLLVVLIGWANQITSKSKEVQELERIFMEKAKLKRSDYKEIVNEKGATEASFNALIDFLFTNKEDNHSIFEVIKLIRADLAKLEKRYSQRFSILLWMSIIFFLTGIIAFFLPPKYEFWTLLPNAVLIVFVYMNLISVNKLEKQYTNNISEALEKL